MPRPPCGRIKWVFATDAFTNEEGCEMTLRTASVRFSAALILLAASGCAADSAAQSNATPLNDYSLEVEGTAGVQLDMLLITRPRPSANPTRETGRITVPYKKQFKAARCYAWFDTLPEGASG